MVLNDDCQWMWMNSYWYNVICCLLFIVFFQKLARVDSYQPYGICLLYPDLWWQDESIRTRRVFKLVEFDQFVMPFWLFFKLI